MARPNKIQELPDGRLRTRINGKYYYVGHKRDRQAAELRFHQLMAEHKPSKSQLVGKPIRVSTLIAQWLHLHSSEHHAWSVKPFVQFTATMQLSDVDVDFVRRYAQWLRTNGYTRNNKKHAYKPKTLQNHCNIARSIMLWAHEHGWLKVAPAKPQIAKPLKIERDVEPDALVSILDSLNPPACHLAKFIAYTGCRPGEARLLQWPQIDFRNHRCILSEHKTAGTTGATRIIYLTPPAVSILKDQKKVGRDSPYVFVSGRGSPYTASGFRRILSRRGITPYQLRHTFAQLASEHLLPQELATLLNHTNVKTTQHYYSVKQQRASLLAQNLPMHSLTGELRPDRPSKVSRAKKKRK